MKMVRLDFEPASITVEAGKVVLYLDNSIAETAHNMAIAASAEEPILARSSVLNRHQTAAFTIDDLPPGTYFFKCEVAGHAAGGMVGTLIAEPATP